jgi:hypothetical protein
LGDQVEKNEMGGTCSTHGEGRDVYRLWWENLREGYHLEDTVIGEGKAKFHPVTVH